MKIPESLLYDLGELRAFWSAAIPGIQFSDKTLCTVTPPFFFTQIIQDFTVGSQKYSLFLDEVGTVTFQKWVYDDPKSSLPTRVVVHRPADWPLPHFFHDPIIKSPARLVSYEEDRAARLEHARTVTLTPDQRSAGLKELERIRALYQQKVDLINALISGHRAAQTELEEAHKPTPAV